MVALVTTNEGPYRRRCLIQLQKWYRCQTDTYGSETLLGEEMGSAQHEYVLLRTYRPRQHLFTAMPPSYFCPGELWVS